MPKIKPQPLTCKPTSRGFGRFDFKDYNDNECSIQESSLATAPMIWLGQDKGTHHMGECFSRMHLTRQMAANLIPLLQHFVKTGELPNNEETK